MTSMQAAAPSPRHGDAHLWMSALVISLLANLGILMMAGIAVIRSREISPELATPPQAETVVTIFPETVSDTPAETSPVTRRFARSSPDQTAGKPERAPFIGERDTRAASERSPLDQAPPLPSQTGVTPRDENDIETTESEYRDGSLEAAPQSSPSTPPQIAQPLAPANRQPAQAAASSSLPPPREQLLEGPNPVEVPVPRETAEAEAPKPTPEPPRGLQTPAEPLEETPPAPKPELPRDPAFSGNQRKTALVGSISRTGRSSLEVADTQLGRYQAALSRAVEQEWQRNCVRHRDFITPGFLTVRFFVEPSGRVRSVQFVGDMETGEVQKGFTLNSIRDAEIPPMPPALRREYADEPLELVFRFYF